jgi:peptide/nickel transport system ATP-binding protein
LPPQVEKQEVKHIIKEQNILEVINLSKFYAGQFGPVQAVKNISFKIKKGECVGLVGESGCGKSTTSAILSRLIDASEGQIFFDKKDISTLSSKNFSKNPIRSDIQMVFQDPTESLNPRYTTRQSISDPLKNLTNMKNDEINTKIIEVSNLVGLPLNLLDRLPHQLSGGQKARVGIARAIVLSPKLLILDEPTASLDVSIQAIILNLLVDLRVKLGMSYLFVSHDLNVVQLLCDYIIVMKEGVIVEQGKSYQIINNPEESYTKSLLEASPKPPELPKAS